MTTITESIKRNFQLINHIKYRYSDSSFGTTTLKIYYVYQVSYNTYILFHTYILIYTTEIDLETVNKSGNKNFINALEGWATLKQLSITNYPLR